MLDAAGLDDAARGRECRRRKRAAGPGVDRRRTPTAQPACSASATASPVSRAARGAPSACSTGSRRARAAAPRPAGGAREPATHSRPGCWSRSHGARTGRGAGRGLPLRRSRGTHTRLAYGERIQREWRSVERRSREDHRRRRRSVGAGVRHAAAGGGPRRRRPRGARPGRRPCPHDPRRIRGRPVRGRRGDDPLRGPGEHPRALPPLRARD